MKLITKIKDLFKDNTSELEIQNNKLKIEVKELLDTSAKLYSDYLSLKQQNGELTIKNNNQTMNLIALRASSKSEIKKLKYQLHMANNRVQILDTELQSRKYDAKELDLMSENAKMKNILYPKQITSGCYVKYLGDREELYGVLFRVIRIKSNGETVLAFTSVSSNTTGYQDCIDGINLSDLRLFDLINNLPQ